MQHHIPEQLCPTCGEHLDAATNVGPTSEGDPRVEPQPGGIVVCMGCGEVLEFTEAMHLEKFRNWAGLPVHMIGMLRTIQLGVRHVQRERARKAQPWANITRC